MAKFGNFSVAKPKETGWFWMQNMTSLEDPEVVLVRPVDVNNPESELGFMRAGSSKVTALSSASACAMQWQQVEWE